MTRHRATASVRPSAPQTYCLYGDLHYNDAQAKIIGSSFGSRSEEPLPVEGSATWRGAMMGVDVVTTDRYVGSANLVATAYRPALRAGVAPGVRDQAGLSERLVDRVVHAPVDPQHRLEARDRLLEVRGEARIQGV